MANIQLNPQQQAQYDAAIKKYGYASPASPPVQQPPQNQNIGSQLGAVNQAPAYNTTSGLLTDYGRSQNLPEVNAPQQPVPTPTPTPTTSSNPYLSQVQALQQLSPAEVDAQTQLNTLQSNATQGQFNVSQQPIAQGFISGQQSAMQTQANIAQQPLQLKLALAQAQRQAALDSAKTALQYQSPVSVGLGTNLVNPLTGATIAEGQSYQAKQGSANVLALSKLYPDAGILPSDDPNIAAQKASASQSFIAKFGKQSAQWNPNTGQFDVINTSRLGTTTPGGSYTGNPNGNGTSVSPGSVSSPALLGGFASVQAVKDFQTTHGLVADGIVGPKTKTAMAAAGMNVPSSPSSNSSKTVVPYNSGSSGGGAGTLASLSGGAFTLATTGDYQSGAYPAQKTAALAEVRKVFPNFNPAVAQANAGAIADQTKQQADVTRGITAADSNFNLLTDTFKGKVNDFGSPLANQVNTLVQKNVLGQSDYINFQSAISTLQTEYATVLGRGGEVTDSVRKSAANVISGNYSMNDLISLHNYIDKEGKNVIDSYTKTIGNLASGTTGSSSSSTSGGTTGVTSSGIKYTIQ